MKQKAKQHSTLTKSSYKVWISSLEYKKTTADQKSTSPLKTNGHCTIYVGNIIVYSKKTM